MPSQSKLIKQGIYLTDIVFDEIIQRVEKGVKASDTLEHFLSKYKEYTNGNGENNPLVINGYKEKMIDIIIKETNNHKFSRPSQKELVRVTIENRVGDLIVDVGDDIKNSVRDIIKEGYNNNLSQDEIAENLTHRVNVIKNTRARTIARTEIARTATASDYVINKERGATHFTVDCRDTCCGICARDYNWGKIEYTIDQVEMLPPRHPNCRCVAYFFKKEGSDGGGINWFYEYNNTKFQFIGNTPMYRQEFLEKFGVDLNELNKEENKNEKLFLQIFTFDSSPLNKFYRLENKTLTDYLLADAEWKTINKVLINKGMISEELSLSEALAMVDDIFDKYSVPVDKDIILCRRERNRYMSPNENGNYNDRGFTSTSIYEFAKEDEYGDEISYILIPKGTPVLYLEGVTSSPEDYEVLFPPNINLSHVEDLSSKKKVWVY